MQVQPYTVHEAEVAVFHAWGDGMSVGGPLLRNLQPPVTDEFRAGLKISQVEAGGGMAADFGEWRKFRPQLVMDSDWMVEMSVPLAAVATDDGVQLSAFLRAGSPVVVVVRFLCTDTGLWRVFQFHDCLVQPQDAGDEGQWMMRAVKFSAGHMEEFKSGTLPPLVPRLCGVIEWRHLGRCVRCWEYDAVTDTLTEDAENVAVVDGDTVRHVSLETVAGGVALSYLLPWSVDAILGGQEAGALGWQNVLVFTVGESSGLIMEPDWEMEAQGCAEPLLLPPSGRHWEHPRVVFRFLGRRYATIEARVFALPALVEDALPEMPMDQPIRIGNLVLYPEGGWLVQENE